MRGRRWPAGGRRLSRDQPDQRAEHSAPGVEASVLDGTSQFRLEPASGGGALGLADDGTVVVLVPEVGRAASFVFSPIRPGASTYLVRVVAGDGSEPPCLTGRGDSAIVAGCSTTDPTQLVSVTVSGDGGTFVLATDDGPLHVDGERVAVVPGSPTELRAVAPTPYEDPFDE